MQTLRGANARPLPLRGYPAADINGAIALNRENGTIGIKSNRVLLTEPFKPFLAPPNLHV